MKTILGAAESIISAVADLVIARHDRLTRPAENGSQPQSLLGNGASG